MTSVTTSEILTWRVTSFLVKMTSRARVGESRSPTQATTFGVRLIDHQFCLPWTHSMASYAARQSDNPDTKNAPIRFMGRSARQCADSSATKFWIRVLVVENRINGLASHTCDPQDGQMASPGGLDTSTLLQAPHTLHRRGSPSGVRDDGGILLFILVLSLRYVRVSSLESRRSIVP